MPSFSSRLKFILSGSLALMFPPFVIVATAATRRWRYLIAASSQFNGCCCNVGSKMAVLMWSGRIAHIKSLRRVAPTLLTLFHKFLV